MHHNTVVFLVFFLQDVTCKILIVKEHFYASTARTNVHHLGSRGSYEERKNIRQ